MARLKGPFTFAGSIGNIRSYYDKKKKCYILATKGGSSKELIENNPSFARTRENMNEFKACGIWASKFFGVSPRYGINGDWPHLF